MNLQENIHRIKEVMGMVQKKLDGSETITLNENTSESILNKMIDELGLYNTIRMVGSYEDLLNHINPEDISESDKIKFIRDVVTSKGPEISGRESISIYDLGVKPIWYDEYKNKIRVITTMYKNGVKVNVYINEIYDDSGMILYSHMPEDAIDRVFKVLTDVLDNKKEGMTEGLHDTSWENDEGDKVTLIDLLDATEDIPVERVSVEELKPHLLSWDGDEEEIKKIDKSDLQYPILIFVDDNNKFISIIDGHHRAHKAVRHKLKTIKAKIIPINSLPKDVRKVFGHLGKQEQNESIVSSTIKRSANRRTLEKYITDGEINYPMLCDDFEDGYEYADAVIDYAIDELLSELDDDIYERDYYSDVMDYLRNFCRNEFGQYLIDIYERTCTEEELDEQQNESEITERCWKGYTQKGMKTMFGKRYPNCVKVKK